MAAGVVVDTSFLITLADKRRSNHGAARQFWRYFTENGVPIYLPTIVVSEFWVKQEIPPEILRSCVVLPFNWRDAVRTAKLELVKERQSDESRVALKDDLKILAQAAEQEAAYVITDDARSFYRFGKRMEEDGAAFKTIRLDDGFDMAFFNGGQRELPLDDAANGDP